MAKILIVEDSPTVRATVKLSVDYKNATVLEAATAVEGVALYDKERPDLVFLDINLPGADGFVVLRRIRSLDVARKTKVVMLTGDNRKETIARAITEGADDFIAKPFSPLVLREKTDKFLP